MKNIKLLTFLNLGGLLIALLLNGLANALPINGKTTGELSDAYPNLFVPAGFTFAIWGVIYLALIAFVGYQLVTVLSRNKAENYSAVLTKIGLVFFLSCLANASWIVAWHYEQVALSVMIMLGLLFSLITIYERLQIGLVSVSPAEKWLVHVPFSLYLGWITVATIANVTALLVNLGWAGFGISEETWAVIMLSVATFIGLTVVQKRKDVAYGLVIIWAFYGIVSKRMVVDGVLYSSITITAMMGMAFIGLAILGSRGWRTKE